jgi:hypothetical protein
MNDLQLIAAQRVVKMLGFRWMPGMLLHNADDGLDYRVVDAERCISVLYDWTAYIADVQPYPDLSDPATVGCLLELAREATHNPHFFPLRVARRERITPVGFIEDASGGHYIVDATGDHYLDEACAIVAAIGMAE